MKNLLCILALLMLVSSCSVTKKAVSTSRTEQHDQSQVDTKRDSTAKSEKKTKDSLVVDITEEKGFEGEKTEYYPLPIDPETGKPPLKSITKFKSESTKETRVEKGSKSETKDSTAVSVSDSSKLDIKTDQKLETKTVKKTRSLWWLWTLLGAVAALGAWLWVRRWWI